MTDILEKPDKLVDEIRYIIADYRHDATNFDSYDKECALDVIPVIQLALLREIERYGLETLDKHYGQGMVGFLEDFAKANNINMEE